MSTPDAVATPSSTSAVTSSATAFTAAKAAGRGALVGYLPVGYPSVPGSLAALRALCGEGGEGPGVDLVEIGLPYSDPMMDGPVIQQAGTRALERGVRTRDVFAAVEAVRSTGTPAVVMTYWNLVDRYGTDAFARDLANAGGSGLITPDLIPDEADDWLAASDATGLDRIFLVSPSSTDARIAATTASVSRLGVRHRRDGGHRHPGDQLERRAGTRPPDPWAVATDSGRRRPGRVQRRPGRGGDRLRRRRHRRLSLPQAAARRRRGRHAPTTCPGCVRFSPT